MANDGDSGVKLDRALILGPGPNGGMMAVRQKGPDSPPQIGEIMPQLKDAPIRGELLDLKPIDGAPGQYDVETLFDPKQHIPGASSQASEHSGLAKVNSQAYRDHWDAIFGGKKQRESAAPPPRPQPFYGDA